MTRKSASDYSHKYDGVKYNANFLLFMVELTPHQDVCACVQGELKVHER